MLLLVVVLLFVSGLLTAYINQQRGYSAVAGFIVGCVLGPLGILLALLSPVDPQAMWRRDQHMEDERIERGDLKKCPYCAEAIKPEARVCRCCGRTLIPEVPQVALALGASNGGQGIPQLPPPSDSKPLVPALVSGSQSPAKPTYEQGASGDGHLNEEALLEGFNRLLGLMDVMARRMYVDADRRRLPPYTGSAPDEGTLGPEDEFEPAVLPRSASSEMQKPREASPRPAREPTLRSSGDVGLPEVVVGVHLQRNEHCHFVNYAEWYEPRSAPRRRNGQRPAGSATSGPGFSPQAPTRSTGTSQRPPA